MNELLFYPELVDDYLKRSEYTPGICQPAKTMYQDFLITPKTYNEVTDSVANNGFVPKNEISTWLGILSLMYSDPVTWLSIGKSTAVDNFYYARDVDTNELFKFDTEQEAKDFVSSNIQAAIEKRVTNLMTHPDNDENIIRTEITKNFNSIGVKRQTGPLRLVSLPDGREVFTKDYALVL